MRARLVPFQVTYGIILGVITIGSLTPIVETSLDDMFPFQVRELAPNSTLPLFFLPICLQRFEAALIVVPVTEDNEGTFVEGLDPLGQRIDILGHS